jgi:hypothetical protein
MHNDYWDSLILISEKHGRYCRLFDGDENSSERLPHGADFMPKIDPKMWAVIEWHRVPSCQPLGGKLIALHLPFNQAPFASTDMSLTSPGRRPEMFFGGVLLSKGAR